MRIKCILRRKRRQEPVRSHTGVTKHHLWAVWRKHNVLATKKMVYEPSDEVRWTWYHSSRHFKTAAWTLGGKTARRRLWHLLWSLGTRWLRTLRFSASSLSILAHPLLCLICLFWSNNRRTRDEALSQDDAWTTRTRAIQITIMELLLLEMQQVLSSKTFEITKADSKYWKLQ